MKTNLLTSLLACLCVTFAVTAHSQDVADAPDGEGATVIYRQVLPNGRVVYSDKAAKGVKVDHTIRVEPPIKGNLWTAESGNRPVVPQQVERTPVRRVASIPPPGQSKTRDEATSDVIRAEMLLEDAKKRQQAGVEPLPGERVANASGGSRLSEAYQKRQEMLNREVVEAEEGLRKAIEERNALR